jgi:predicted branched-subunit amino acid permease
LAPTTATSGSGAEAGLFSVPVSSFGILTRVEQQASDPRAVRRAIHRMAASLGLAVVPFGLAFGVAAVDAGIDTPLTCLYSLAVFTGSAQLAAVQVIHDGGAVAAAVAAGLLLNLRSLAFGLTMAPALGGRWWQRALVAQLNIDEAMAVGAAQRERRWQRYGFIAGGLAVFVAWNTSTLAGALLGSGTADLIERGGLDAAAPAAFLALLWPRLVTPAGRVAAGAGGAIALGLVPVAPAGLPIVAASLGAVAARLFPRR